MSTADAAAPSHARTALAIGSLAFFLITLDILIVNLALPQISAEVGGGATGRQWVIDGYTLPFAALLLFAGSLSDRIGARRALVVGTALFLLASIGCALAGDLAVLIGARVAQGAAAAVMLPASLSLIREGYPDPRRRAEALGVWAVGGAVAATVGPLAGGVLTTLDWRLVFAINVPACAAMLLLLPRVRRSPVRPARFDPAGQVAAVVTLTALVASLIEGGAVGFDAPLVLAGLALAAVAGVGFVLLEARVPHPMLPLGLLRPAGMRLALAIGFVFMVANFGTVFLVSLHLQQQLGLPPLQAGLLFFPSALLAIAANLGSGRITNRFGTRAPVAAGLTMILLGVVGMIAVAPLASPWPMAATLFLTGPGGALAMPSVTGMVLSSVEAGLAGTASAVFNTFRQVGGAVAIAVFGALIAGPAGFLPGFAVSLAITAVLLAVVIVLALVVRMDAPPTR